MEPSWVPDAVFYALNPDRFKRVIPHAADYDEAALEPWDASPEHKAFKGGTLYGVLHELDYLRELGVNALYLTPIFTSPTHHRYKTIDYFNVDPLLGGNVAFEMLLTEAHRRGIRIVLDGVFNHVGIGFPRFQDALEYGKRSPWRSWFYTQDWPEYKCWNGNRSMPVLNHHNPFVVEYILNVAEHWVRKGIDGWRFDAPQHIDAPGFWQSMRSRLCAINPDVYLFGEIWTHAERWLDGTQWHGATNYPLMGAIHRFVGGQLLRAEYLLPGTPPQLPLEAAGFARELEDLNNRYAPGIVLRQFNFLGTHDTARCRSLFGEDEDRIEMATALLMTLPGVPCIYYGDEVGMSGGPPPASRGGFPPEERRNQRCYKYHRELISLRKHHPALRNETLKIVYAQHGCLALERSDQNQTLLAVFNTDDFEARINVKQAVSKLYGRGDYAGSQLIIPPRSVSFWM